MSRRWWFKPKITTESSPHSNLIIYILRINFCPHSVTVWVVSLQNQKSKPTNTHRSQGLMLLPRKCTSFSYLFEMHVVMVTQLLSDWSVLSALTGFWDITREESCPLSAYCSWHTSVCVSIRGSVEPGVEALLRSAGGSLLHLSISQCPHILTDRTLWLASCYSRNLQTLTYRWGCLPVPFFTCLSAYSTVCLVICRSSSDPLGQEVLWALGAGCRSITSLQVAPAHPWLVHTHTVHCDNSILKNNKPVSLFKKKKKKFLSCLLWIQSRVQEQMSRFESPWHQSFSLFNISSQQPTRFGNRCLQTIGRCWPHLRSLSVGGAGCGTQGLVAAGQWKIWLLTFLFLLLHACTNEIRSNCKVSLFWCKNTMHYTISCVCFFVVCFVCSTQLCSATGAGVGAYYWPRPAGGDRAV